MYLIPATSIDIKMKAAHILLNAMHENKQNNRKLTYMKNLLLAALCACLLLQPATAQFRYDNSLFRTVFWDELCKDLPKQSSYLLLDVRSKGEYNDTSASTSLNIGRLKGAMNIDIRELPNRLGELEAYRDKTIYVYCSHSQRSRRVSKLLSEKGFTKVVNVNGGMTMFNVLRGSSIPCASTLYESSIPYHLLSPAELCRLPAGAYTILDIRPDSVFRQISTNERQNAYGRLRGAVNIPLEQLAGATDRLPRNKKIVLVDDGGSESPRAARILEEKGYKDPEILFNGMDLWSLTDPQDLPCKKDLTERPHAYELLSPEAFHRMMLALKDPLVLDIRTAAEFSNQAKDSWRNIGNVRDAVNIPGTDLPKRTEEIAGYRNKPVILYGFSTNDDVFTSAKWLATNGFTKVCVLMGGIFDLRWMAANVKDRQYLSSYVINILPDNK